MGLSPLPFLFFCFIFGSGYLFSYLTKIAVMKTHNLHPVWYNQPLRLNDDQLNNPEFALDDFFEFYHLNEVREILWQWVTEVVSSPRNISSSHHDRHNHLFFYEKLEGLVEAAWVINRGKAPVVDGTSPTFIRNEQKDRYSKPERLIEKVAVHPIAVIQEVFSQLLLNDLQEDLLPTWFRVALINAEGPYADGNAQELLYEFYEQLLLLVQALHELSNNNQFSDLSTVVTGFFQHFSIEYIRRELADFLEAGIGHQGNYPDGFTPWLAWMTYNDILCLVEAAYQLYKTNRPLSKIAEPNLINFMKNV